MMMEAEFLDGVPFLEPFSIIPAIAAVTEKLGFLPYTSLLLGKL